MSVLDMSYNEIISISDINLKNKYLKEYKDILKKYLNRPYTKALKKGFHIENEESKTLREIINETYDYLKGIGYSKEDIEGIIARKR